MQDSSEKDMYALNFRCDYHWNHDVDLYWKFLGILVSRSSEAYFHQINTEAVSITSKNVLGLRVIYDKFIITPHEV